MSDGTARVPTDRPLFSRRAVGSALVSIAAFTGLALITVGPSWPLTGPVLLQLLPALAALAGLFAGPAAVVGTVLGYLAYQLFHGVFDPWLSLGYLAFGLAASGLRNALDRPSDRGVDTDSGLGIRRTVAVVAVASLYVGTVTAWGYELTGRFQFFPTSVVLSINSFLSAVLLGGVGAAVLTRSTAIGRALSRLRSSQPSLEPPADAGGRWPLAVVAVPVAWLCLGSIAAVGFYLIELVPAVHFRSRGLEPLLFLEQSWIFGRHGSKLQTALGVTAMTLLVLALRRWRLNRPESDARN
ncbi:hypothetical protein [Halobellus rarus]|uniref:ECF transporter S component n=1 Tax=Halobellus rarus TaxID=1126237 RepID=A0ABD6CJU9_9EURY|nr:hypothetical protein [Halobellus rarus]